MSTNVKTYVADPEAILVAVGQVTALVEEVSEGTQKFLNAIKEVADESGAKTMVQAANVIQKATERITAAYTGFSDAKTQVTKQLQLLQEAADINVPGGDS
jgi:ElaB/YqjD/DUF883 family membrane-anchored ribosome-binding protein